MNDALVLFMPSGRRGRFALGTTVLDAARSLGVYVESVCGGRGLCGRCQVEPAEGVFAKHGVTSRAANLAPADAAEAPYRGTGRLRDGRRLSCAARVLGDVVIDVPAEFAVNAQVVRKRAETRAIDPAPAVRLVTVAVPPPDMEHPLGDADRLAEAVGAALDPALLPEVQRVLRAGNWTVTAAVHADGPPTVLALWPGLRLGVYGVAFDVGSTTIAGHLVDLATGRALASAGTTNPQIRFGEDLMSRVSYAMLNPGGAAAMTVAVRQAVAALVARLVTQAGVPDDAVLEAVFVANPVMHHLLLGLDPTELGQAPFALAISGPVRVTAASLGRLGLATGARVYVLPCIAGHVGADAAAVALADGPQHHDEPTLVVDVGTNAELLLGHRSRVLAASSPTGPAFEGAQISGGQRAAPGAIERVRIDPLTWEPKLRVIGADAWSDEPGFDATAVTGICGSGIIEVVAEMFLAGIVAADGAILERDHPRLVRQGRTWSYVLWEGDVPLRVTQADIRAIQLAKGALYAGARLLMDRLGVDRVSRVKLAGAFGNHIDPLHAMVLGLIPDCALERVTSIGNSAGTGARMALASLAHRAEVEALVRRIEKVETALEPAFQTHFVNAMAFPNAVEPFPELARAVTLPTPAACRTKESLEIAARYGTLTAVIVGGMNMFRAVVASLGLAFVASGALAQSTPIYQNRDEPGRNPYQELQYGCSTTNCTLTFQKVPVGRERVITSLACDQFVPNGGNVAYAALQNQALPQIFIPLTYTYAGPYNSGAGYIYVANLSPLAFFHAGQTPSVTLLGDTALANAHCNLSGYDVKSP